MTVTIYHNPRCSKSRATLELLEENGAAPEIVDYLVSPPSEADIKAILAKLAVGPRDIMRRGEDVYRDLGLDDEALSDEALITAMHQHPILIERPIVVNGEKAALGRPPESVLDIL